MLLLTLFNTDIQFAEKVFIWRSYTIVEALFITKRAKLIGKQKFIATVLDKNVKIFVVYIATLETILIHPTQEAQITLL